MGDPVEPEAILTKSELGCGADRSPEGLMGEAGDRIYNSARRARPVGAPPRDRVPSPGMQTLPLSEAPRSATASEFLRRVLRFQHMDFEYTVWQMLYLCVNPTRIY